MCRSFGDVSPNCLISFLVWFGLLSAPLFTRLTICSLYFYDLLFLVISRFGFEGRIRVLIASVPGHCLLATLIIEIGCFIGDICI